MLFVGIDPGKLGALAFLAASREPRLVPMPLIKHLRGQGRDEFDLAGLRDLLKDSEPPSLVTIERGQPLPPKLGGAMANFQRGYSRGVIEGLCCALRIPYQLVAPQAWQRVMHQGTPAGSMKQRSILAAQRLFPDVVLRRSPRCWTLDDGMAEALLLAEFGRRTHQGRQAG